MRNRPVGLIALLLFGFAGFVAVGCGSNGASTQGSIPPTVTEAAGHRHRVRADDASCCIKHVFVIVQENRSFNNIFAGYPCNCTTMTGEIAPAPFSTASPTTTPLHPVPLATALDIDHCYYDAKVSMNGGLMDGYYYESLNDPCGPTQTYAGMNPYAYVQRSDVEEYWDIANSWVLAGNFYPTEYGPSFTAHLNIIAGTTEIGQNQAVADVPNSIAMGLRRAARDGDEASDADGNSWPLQWSVSVL